MLREKIITNRLNKNKFIRSVKYFAEENSLTDDIHGFEHVKRVYELSLKIGKKYEANLFVLKVAALFHDIGRVEEKDDPTNQNHAELSALKASKFLKNKIEQRLNPNIIQNIIHAIQAHSFSNNVSPTTLEAKILSDADKLDALGAIGLYRTIGFTVKHQGNIKDVIKHLENKLLKLKNRMYLQFSKQIARERHQILSEFHTKIKKEM